MITYEDIHDAQEFLIDEWGEAGKTVISVCSRQTPFNDTTKNFLTHCIACGGNWGGMFLSGIKALYPEVWDVIPDDMGTNAFGCLCYVLVLLGVDDKKIQKPLDKSNRM